MKKKYNPYFLIIIIIIYVSITFLFYIDRPLSTMEGEEFRALSASGNIFQLLFNRVNLSFIHQPINTIILKFLYYDHEISIVSLRIFYLIFATLSIIYVFKIFTLFNNGYIPLVLTLLYSLNPLVLFYGTSIQSYIVLVLYFLGHLYYLLTYIDKKKKLYLILSLIFLNFAFFTHMTSFFYGALLLLLFIVDRKFKYKEIYLLLLSFIPIAIYCLVSLIVFDQLSWFRNTAGELYFYFKSSDLPYLLAQRIRVAYSLPHWSIPVVIVFLASLCALRSRYKYSKFILVVNLLFIIDTVFIFMVLYFNNSGYFTVRHSMILVPIFFINLAFLFNVINNNKLKIGCLLILVIAMTMTSISIYRKNKPVDYAALNDCLVTLVADKDSLFFIPKFTQLPFDYHVINACLNNIIYDSDSLHFTYFRNKKIYLLNIGDSCQANRNNELQFVRKKIIKRMFHYHCRLNLENIWIVIPKERIFGIYHLNYDLIEHYLQETSNVNTGIYIKPVVKTDTFDIFQLSFDPFFCYNL